MNLCNVPKRTFFLRDNMDVLRGINSDCIDLIYLDPPFNKNKTFKAPVGSSAEGAEFSDIFREEDVKDEWLTTIRVDKPELFQYLNGIKGVGKPYNFAYLAYMAIRFTEYRRILKETGSLYLHCDPTMSHYLKTTLDCIFGERNFRNEVIWGYRTQGVASRWWPRKHDTLLLYTNGIKWTFHPQQERQFYRKAFRHTKVDEAGRYYVDSFLRDVWDHDDTKPPISQAAERTGYPTQKPLALLDRIINASSNEGDIVLDPFCGCATTCIAAEKVNRQWIGIDVSVKAYELVKRRLDAEVARPHELPTERREVHLKTNPPRRTDIGASVRETRHVYIISHPMFAEYFKVGVAKDVKARLNSYQTSDPHRSYKLEFSHETHLYFEIEAHVHTHFDNQYEWVKANLEDIKREILNYDVGK